MRKIIDMLCHQGRKKETDGRRTECPDKMGWEEFMEKCRKAELVVKALLDVELGPLEDRDEERFHIAPLNDLDEEYMNMFANPPMDNPARQGKMSYLRSDYHNRIRTIVNALDTEGINISSYVDMVLTDHFTRYGKQIDRLLQNCYEESRKQQKQWLPS